MSRTRTRVVVGVGVTALVATLTVPAASAAAPGTPERGMGTAVTLLTGDVVTVVGTRALVRPGEGRRGIRFAQRVDVEGDVHVVPSDVAADVVSGRLDGRLFDVGGLIRAGYDDRRSRVTPLIISHDGPRIAGSTGERRLASVDAVAVKADKSAPFLSAARAAGVERIWLDGPVRATLDRSVPQIGAPTAWAAGHTGAGTAVAVLDTGVDGTHPDLAGAVVGERDFTGSGSTTDRFGHGTHVAATVTGGGKYQGVAPDARLLNGKVLDDFGGGTESGIIAGMEWAAAEGADVVNMSLGSSFPTDGTDPMSLAVNRLTEETGALFVVSAGNSGPSAGTIGSPAAADAALTVGAVDRADTIVPFSSRGPRTKDGAVKPDITAPGVGIVAAKAAEGVIGDPVGDAHVALSGTSMSAPHVAGAAALLAGQHPDWTPEQVKATLMAAAVPHPELSAYEQGAGRVDLARAIGQRVTSAPASLSMGTARWPHDDDQPIQRTLAYRNTGSEPLTLRVSADLRDERGEPAPQGMLTVSPAEVTVPAGGQAEVSVTATTSLDSPDGRYSGAVTATGGGASVRTPLGLDKEVESYDVAVTAIDGNGAPAPNYFASFIDLAKPVEHSAHDPSGSVVIRVPKGRYFVHAVVFTSGDGVGEVLTLAAEPSVTVDRDTEMVVDARRGEPVRITVDRPDARAGFGLGYFDVVTEWGPMSVGVLGPGFDGVTFVPSATSAPGKATFGLEARLARPSGEHAFVGSPYQYNVGWTVDARIPAELTRRFPDRTLVKVKTSVSGPGTGFVDSMAGGGLPYELTEYNAPGIAWFSVFDQVSSSDAQLPVVTQMTVVPPKFTEATAQRWNAAVFGPALPAAHYPDQWAARYGDEMYAGVPMFTDQGENHAGYSVVDTARTTLHRGGQLIAESPYDGAVSATDPGGSGTYRLRTEATRSVSPLSTRVAADWTFTSATTEEPQALPLLVVRFSPKLDDRNRARAGVPFAVPVHVQRNGSTAESVRTPSVQVSYDDGKTWKPTRLVRIGERWHALLVHPRGAVFVSLKAQAGDAQGNSVDQTIIRAYALK